MKCELFKAAQYAECHGIKFDPSVVYTKIMEIQSTIEKKEKKCGYGAA